MPKTKVQGFIYAFLTVFITVHAFVFYNTYVVEGEQMLAATGETSVLAALNTQGGIYMFGHMMPIWSVILVEVCFALTAELLIGNPMSLKIAFRKFNPEENLTLFQTTIVFATVAIMCPIMSFIASIIYYPYFNGFNVITMLANWFKLVCYNLPFAFFSQLLFIQPFMRKLFKIVFGRNKEANKSEKYENALAQE